MSHTKIEIHPDQRYASLDFLRAGAIIWVFLFHYRNSLDSAYQTGFIQIVGQHGWAGVDLFFVLSGFLIGSQLLKPLTVGATPSLKEFFLRRSFRILPNYWVVLGLYFLVPTFAEKEGMPPVWKFLTFTQNIGLDRFREGAFSHAWSLCVEEHFYMALPLIVLLLRKRANLQRVIILIVSIILLGMIYRATAWAYFVAPLLHQTRIPGFTSYVDGLLYYPTYARLDGLVMGVTIALIYRLRPLLWKKMEPWGNFLGILGLSFLTIGLLLSKSKYESIIPNIFMFPAVSLGLGCVVMASLFQRNLFSKLNMPGARGIATLSFSLYLVHKQIIHLVLTHTAGLNLAAQGPGAFIISVFTSLCCSIILYVTIERPALSMRSRILSLIR